MSNPNNIFTPVVDADAAYGEGDWRSILGEGPRHDGWKLYAIGKTSVDSKLHGVILPSHDYSLSLSDQSFRSAFAPCWTDQPQKNNERHFTPSAFALPMTVYPFLGPNKEHWLSPSNKRNMIGNDSLDADDSLDAFDDLNRWVRRNKQFSQERKDFFLKAEKMTEDPLVPGRSMRYFSLNECHDKDNTKWHLAVTMYTTTAYSYLIEQMRWLHQDDVAPRDPNWPRYMLGDPTAPSGALEWHVDKVQLDAKDPQQTNVLCFTERREFLDPKQKVRAISQEVLDARFLLPDPANWNFPTYEEQVEFMMRHYDPAVTADMIRAACAYRCRFEIPSQRPESVRLQGESAATDDTNARGPRQQQEPSPDPTSAVTGGGRYAPRSTPPMPRQETQQQEPLTERTTAAAPSQTQEKRYSAGARGSKASQMTVAELQALVDSGQHEGYKVKVDNEWKPIESCGLVRMPSADSDQVPIDDEVPEDDVPTDTVPSDAAPATGKQGITLSEMRTKLFPDPEVWEALSDARKEQADALVKRAWEATDYGVNPELPADIVAELLPLFE